MPGKVKMRCAKCGKPFKASGSKQTLCNECAAKERAARANAKVAGAAPVAATPKIAVAPKIVGPGASILVPGMSAEATPVPSDSGSFGVTARNDERTRQHAPAERPRTPPAAGAKSAQHEARPTARAPRLRTAQRERRAPQRPFELTDEMRASVETRYLELAEPVEFDGIRTQIATELNIPKSVVKRAIVDLRTRMQLPSWWELKGYTGSEQDLARIRQQYAPLLPVPPVGVHKRIATELALDPIQVYRGIRRIRAEMRLPQYNPPDSHQSQTASPLASQ